MLLPSAIATLTVARALTTRLSVWLISANVKSVAVDLGVSERHLRRLFRKSVGMSPKEFARVARFRHARRTAREGSQRSWADIAAETGYYDQAHLTEDFRAIAGVTPRVLLSELGAA
jgi:transcriptional regulator GlxA family with amidase domain